jgi:hypothetical protein
LEFADAVVPVPVSDVEDAENAVLAGGEEKCVVVAERKTV